MPLPVPRRNGVPGADPRAASAATLRQGTFANPPAALEKDWPYLAIVNADTVGHTITFTPLQTGSDHASVAVPISVNGIVAIPTLPFAGCSIDAAGTAASVGWFYTDIPPAGPRGAAGSSSPITFPTGAQIVDDGAGGVKIIGSDGGTAFDVINHKGDILIGGGNNATLDNATGIFDVYGTLQTTGRGLFSIVGPTGTQPSDNGTVFVPTGSTITTAGPVFHPKTAKKIRCRISGLIEVKVAGGGTYTFTVTFVDAHGDAKTETLALQRDNGAMVTAGTTAEVFSFSREFLALAANEANAITSSFVVAGAAGNDYAGHAILEWADTET